MRRGGCGAMLRAMSLLLNSPETPLTVRCASVQDIAPVLAYAREAGLALGEEGGIVLDLSA